MTFRKRQTWKAVAKMTQEEEKDGMEAEAEPEAEAETETEAPEGAKRGKREKPLHDAAGNYIGPRREA